MNILWTAATAAAATRGRAIGDWQASGVAIDSRSLQPGDLFVALQAARDGHDFVADALARGAAAALVARVPDGVAADAPLLVVSDVLAALVDLGRAARERMRGQVVAITGSVGKTSTKEMLRVMLGPHRRVHLAEASYNNHWGVPLTLARMPADTEVAVLEIGMNQPGEIAPLARLARPHVVLITTVAPAHLAAFDSLAGIAAEKAAILEGLEPRGTAVLPGDLEVSAQLIAAAKARRARIVTFGGKGCDWRLGRSRAVRGVTVAEAWMPGDELLFKVNSPGRHFAVNALGALAVVAALGGDAASAAADLGHWHPGPGRGQYQRIALDVVNEPDYFELIDDAFNANPASVAAALELFVQYAPRDGVGRIATGRRIAILGDMLELGPDEVAQHRALADHPALAKVTTVHCVGPLMRHLWQALPPDRRGEWHPDADALVARVADLVDAGDVVLVKGSKSIRVSRVVDALRRLGQDRPPSSVEGV